MVNLSWEQMSEYLDVLLEMETSVYMQETLMQKINEQINTGGVFSAIEILRQKNFWIKKAGRLYNYDRLQYESLKILDKARQLEGLEEDIEKAQNFNVNSIEMDKHTHNDSSYMFKVYKGGAIIRVAFGRVLGDEPTFGGGFTPEQRFIHIDATSEFEARAKINSIYYKAARDIPQMIDAIKEYVRIEKNKTDLMSEALIPPILKNLENTKRTLEELYNINIIFPKYRNLVAVASFNEYWQTGRVTELAGPNGAYNLYESETRMNQIITRLDTIIEKLDQIKQSQYLLYTAINDTNNLLKGVTDKLNTISSNTSDINSKMSAVVNNTAMTAINTKITACNTRAIKYMTMYNTLFK